MQRLTASGVPDSSFGGGPGGSLSWSENNAKYAGISSEPHCVDGSLLPNGDVVGLFDESGGSGAHYGSTSAIEAVTPNGQIDYTFGHVDTSRGYAGVVDMGIPGANYIGEDSEDVGYGLATLSNGKFFVGASSGDTVVLSGVLGFGPDGVLDKHFARSGSGALPRVAAGPVATQFDRQAIVGGEAFDKSTGSNFAIGRFRAE